ncbi:MAG: GNAT family N-acetyltransferase [Phycisphaerae bacterium]|jgi:ribosomal-protein-alanine N-acetyltransferase
MSSSARLPQAERLQFRRLTMDDLDPLAELYADPDVMRYIGVGGVRTRDGTREKLRELIDAEASQGFGVWATIEWETGTFIGRCGLMTWEIEGQHELEVLYLLGRPYWGRGLGTEAAIAIRDYAEQVLHKRRLIALIHGGNHASRRVAEKAGFRHEREVSFQGHHVAMFARVC